MYYLWQTVIALVAHSHHVQRPAFLSSRSKQVTARAHSIQWLPMCLIYTTMMCTCVLHWIALKCNLSVSLGSFHMGVISTLTFFAKKKSMNRIWYRLHQFTFQHRSVDIRVDPPPVWFAPELLNIAKVQTRTLNHIEAYGLIHTKKCKK